MEQINSQGIVNMKHALHAPAPYRPPTSHSPIETFENHYAKYHQAYVTDLNSLIKDTEYEKLSLEEILKQAPAGDIQNMASQLWSHTFFWNYMKPDGCVPPTGALANAISKKWGSFDEFKMALQTSAVANFAAA